VVVETPVNLSREQKDLLQNLEDSLLRNAGKHHPREETWLDGVRRFFGRLTE
jgi:molecular chaperone DnaJ